MCVYIICVYKCTTIFNGILKLAIVGLYTHTHTQVFVLLHRYMYINSVGRLSFFNTVSGYISINEIIGNDGLYALEITRIGLLFFSKLNDLHNNFSRTQRVIYYSLTRCGHASFILRA